MTRNTATQLRTQSQAKRRTKIDVGADYPPSAHSLIMIALVLLFSAPLEAAVLNIVAIGASNTSGWGVGPQDAYPARLQALLRKKAIPANVINAGVLGVTTAGMLQRVDSAVP